MRKTLLILAFASLGCGFMSDSARAAGPPVKAMNEVLVNVDGMTLYTYDKDRGMDGKSVCNDRCAENWPPLLAAPDSNAEGDYSIIMRDDASSQWAYKGQPLYLYKRDMKQGDMAGDDVQNVWHVIKQ
ncbi:hypothetical protein JHL22_12090 [Advenella sp. WQ 585]|uniref:Lipoprotein n=1 Tax=Advenella mandrilli TaxID=2800330 RepID=A0ABS1EG29_9BURK|nr:hypothetical protein [Advenella mandrilli]